MGTPNFRNRTLWIADNLPVMRGINSECVDLIVTDPPFNSDRLYNAPLGSEAAGAQFEDTWTMDGIKEEWADLLEAADPAMFHTVSAAGLCGDDSMQAYLTFMAPRLTEMHRILKPSGSLYLHCDSVASHYLKQLLDCVFGAKCYANEIVWKRTGSKALGARRYSRDSDRILYYRKGSHFVWNQQYRPHDPEYVKKAYRYDDDNGLGAYALQPLTGGKAGGPEAYRKFRGALPSAGRAWAPPRRNKFPPEAAEALPEEYENSGVIAKCEALDDAGLIHWTKNRIPLYKSYLSTKRGIPASDFVGHIKRASGNEKTGWPTQKPLALYELFIKASSGPEDLVLDPFAGCATTMVAAERLHRRWAGIDIDEVATGITIRRLQQESDNEAFLEDLSTRTLHLPSSPPERTDRHTARRSRNIRAILWHQLGTGDRRVCCGCDRKKYYDDFHLDHIQPRSKGGADTDENLQLLCGACNTKKGNRLSNKELRASNGLTRPFAGP